MSFLTKDVISDADHILGVKKPSFFNAARGLGHQDCGAAVRREPVELVGIEIYMVIGTYMWIFVQAPHSGGLALDLLSPTGGKAPVHGATAGYWA